LSVFLSISFTPQRGHAKDKYSLIQFYQDHISGIDGNRCPMTPSCSQYASQAFEKHGVLMGWIMSLDRVVRCGRDEVKISPSVSAGGARLTYDPVSANDFWWFNQKDE